MLQEFQKFIMRGNVIDLAVGVVIGTAFGAIVTSLVNDIIMPPLGVVLSGIDFSNLFWVLSGTRAASVEASRQGGAAVIAYGAFINACIRFLIIAFAIFLLVKAVNKAKDRIIAKEEAAPAGPTKQEKLLMEIRDAIKARG